MDAIQALAKQCGFTVVHRFSCEILEASQRWILQQCQPAPGILYRDVMQFIKGNGSFCVKGQRNIPAMPCDMPLDARER